MRKLSFLIGSGLLACTFTASADFIEVTAGCPGDPSCDSSVTDNYSFIFKISDTTSPNIFDAILTNTSPPNSSGGPRIDQMAFNINATLFDGSAGDFMITNVNPNWSFSSPTGGGIQFDYVGDADSPGDKLDPNESLTFKFDFVNNDFIPDNPFELWTGTDSSSGNGIGGGGDTGQVAVSFQTLGSGGNDSDLLAGLWGPVIEEPPVDPTEIPEPNLLALLGFGMLGMAVYRRRRFAS